MPSSGVAASTSVRTRADPTMTPSANSPDLGGLVAVGDPEADAYREIGDLAGAGDQRLGARSRPSPASPVTPMSEAA